MRDAVQWVRPLRSAATARMFFGIAVMIGSLFSLARPLIHALDAETAHRLAVRGAEIRAGARLPPMMRG